MMSTYPDGYPQQSESAAAHACSSLHLVVQPLQLGLQLLLQLLLQ
jgi:hypothetical protein